MRLAFLAFVILFSSGIALAEETPQDLLKQLQSQFPCEGERHCFLDAAGDNREQRFGAPEIYDLSEGYKLLALYDKLASGTMSLYELYLQDKNGKFYHLEQGAGVCVDGKNLLLINLGHCSAAETSFDIRKIDLDNKRLLSIKSFSCTSREIIDKYMQDNFPNSVSYNSYGKCDFNFWEEE